MGAKKQPPNGSRSGVSSLRNEVVNPDPTAYLMVCEADSLRFEILTSHGAISGINLARWITSAFAKFVWPCPMRLRL